MRFTIVIHIFNIISQVKLAKALSFFGQIPDVGAYLCVSAPELVSGWITTEPMLLRKQNSAEQSATSDTQLRYQCCVESFPDPSPPRTEMHMSAQFTEDVIVVRPLDQPVDAE